VAGPLKHDRDLNAFRNRYGIKDAEWSDDSRLASLLRATVTTDDVSHLAKPLCVPIGIYQCEQGAGGVGVYSGCQVVILSPNGAYINSIGCSPVLSYVTTENLSVFTSVAAVTPDIIPGDVGAPVSTVHEGTIPNIPNGCRIASFLSNPDYCPFWLPMGTVMQVFSAVANSGGDVVLSIQEIP